MSKALGILNKKECELRGRYNSLENTRDNLMSKISDTEREMNTIQNELCLIVELIREVKESEESNYED